MSCCYPVHTSQYGVCFSCTSRTFLSLVRFVVCYNLSVFSLEQHVANYFPPGQVRLINPQKVHTLPHLITSTVKQEIGYPFSMTEFHNISHEQNNIKRIMDHLKSSFVHLLSVIQLSLFITIANHLLIESSSEVLVIENFMTTFCSIVKCGCVWIYKTETRMTSFLQLSQKSTIVLQKYVS